jgi:putative acetyltransferase
MYALIGAADALGEPLIGLLGDPAYYSRFGFVASSELGVYPPEVSWGAHFQVLRLTTWSEAITGVFHYAAPFDSVG